MSPILASIIGTSTLLTICSSSAIRFKSTYRPVFQPKNGAFSIWGVIFSLLLASSATMFVNQAPNSNSVIFVSASLILCSLWTLNFSEKKYIISFLLLLFGTLTSLVGLTFLKKSTDIESWLYETSFSLLSGWLFVATLLGFSIAMHENDIDDFDSYYMLLFASLFVYSTSIIVKKPILNVPILWALLFQSSINPIIVVSFGVNTLGLSKLFLTF